MLQLPPLPYLSIMVLAPLLGMFIIIFLPKENERAIHLTSLITTGLAFVVAILVWFAYDKTKGGMQFREELMLVPQFGIAYNLGIDGISVPMMLLNGIVGFGGTMVSMNEIHDRPKEFFALFTLLVSGVSGVFVSLDLFVLFLFYELAVLPMYILIAVWGSTRKEYAAMKLTLFLLFGSALMLVGIIALFLASQGQVAGATNTLSAPTFDLLKLGEIKFTEDFQRIFFLPLFLGFAVLAGLWPFHIWSPDGHVAAPSAVSMIHAGVLMKLGAFGCLRVAMFLMPEGARLFLPTIAILTLVNAVYGALVAMQQRDLKYMVGYSSVSHMGYVIMGLSTLNHIGIAGAVMQMFSHGVMTALFFACIGFVYHQAHTRQVDEFGGIIRKLPFLGTCFIIGCMASVGMPGLSGFVAEFLIFIGVWQYNPWISILAMLAVVFTAIYLLRAVQRVFFGELNPRWRSLHDMTTPLQRAPILLLVFFLFLFGLAPWLLVDMINVGISPIVARLANEAGQAFTR